MNNRIDMYRFLSFLPSDTFSVAVRPRRVKNLFLTSREILLRSMTRDTQLLYVKSEKSRREEKRRVDR